MPLWMNGSDDIGLAKSNVSAMHVILRFILWRNPFLIKKLRLLKSNLRSQQSANI